MILVCDQVDLDVISAYYISNLFTWLYVFVPFSFIYVHS